MATEAVVSDQTCVTDEVEKHENEEVTSNGQKSVSLSNANEEKHDKVEDITLSGTEAEDKVGADKTDDSPAIEEKEAMPDSQNIIVTESASDTAPEKESADTGEEKQPGKENIPQPPAEETIEESSKIKPLEINPLIESELVKETPKPEAAEAQEISQEPEKEPQEQPNTVAIPEEAIQKHSKTVEEKQREPEPEAEVVKPEPVIAEVLEKSQEQEKESPQKEKEQENTAVVVPEASAETIKDVREAVEEIHEPYAEVMKETETSETGSQNLERPDPIEGNPNTESEAEGVKETENSESIYDKVEKSEPVVTQVQGKSKEDSKKGEEQENKVAVVTEGSSETIEKVIDAVEEKPREVVKETEEPEPGVTKIEENPSEPKEKFVEKVETVIPEKTAETTQKPLDIDEDHSTKESDIQVVEETDKADPLPVEAEKPQVESKKPSEKSQVAQVEVEVKSKDVEIKQEVVRENESAKSEGTSDTVLPTLLKEGETPEEEETAVTNKSEAQAAVVEEDYKKESSYSDVFQDLAKGVVGVSATTDQGSDKKESNVEEKVTANDAKESSREAVVEIHKVGEQNEAKTGTIAESGDKVESVKHEDGLRESKVEEGIAAVTEPVRETLASKLQEKEETKLGRQHVEDTEKTQEPATKENDTVKTSKDLPKETPAKPAQKHSNNILSKVKQSLVKAKKAITGKSPNSKTLSSDTHGDIKVK